MKTYTVHFPDVNRAYRLKADNPQAAIQQAEENMEHICRFPGLGRIYL